jgi:predicted Zn-dependent peptidase
MTYSIGSYPIVYNDAGLFVIEMAIHPNELKNCIKATLKELKKIKTSEIGIEEYKKAATIIKNESIFSSNLPVDWFTYFGLNFLYNRNFNPNLKSNENITRKVTRKDITQIAQQIFDKKKINLFLFGNIPDDDFDFMKL